MTTLLGDITASGDGYDLEFERILATDVRDLWSAVTDPARLAQWMAVYTGELALGGTWHALSDDGSIFCTGTVAECEPGRRFVTSWHAIEERPTTLEVTVSETADGAKLHLRHEGVQSVRYGAGWQTYLEQLDDLIGPAASSVVDASRTPGIGWDERFGQLQEGWLARMPTGG